jgi:hypothetical protein
MHADMSRIYEAQLFVESIYALGILCPNVRVWRDDADFEMVLVRVAHVERA